MQPKPDMRKVKLEERYAEIEALAERASLGDKDALYSLCEKLAGSVFFHVRCMLGNEMDAEDVTQNVLLRMCEKIGGLRESRAFRAWLCGIEINETRRFISMHARYGDVLNIEDHVDGICESHAECLPQEYVESKGLSHDVMDIVARLPVRQREAVILHYYDEMNINEVASAMRISHQNASRYLTLARKKIKAELESIPLSSRINALAVLSVSSLISDTFQTAALSFNPLNTTWIQSILERCQQNIFESSLDVAAATAGAVAETVAAFRVSFAALMGSLSTIFVAGALALGITFGGTAMPEVVLLEPPPGVEGRIVFTSGIDGFGEARVNPVRADLHMEGAEGDYSILQWWITSAGSEIILFEDQGGELEDVFGFLRESGAHGEYNLFIRFNDESGTIFRLLSNFYIEQ